MNSPDRKDEVVGEAAARARVEGVALSEIVSLLAELRADSDACGKRVGVDFQMGVSANGEPSYHMHLCDVTERTGRMMFYEHSRDISALMEKARAFIAEQASETARLAAVLGVPVPRQQAAE